MFDRFDRDARLALVYAQTIARDDGTEQVGAAHLFDGLLFEARERPGGTAAGRVLALVGVDPAVALTVSRTFAGRRRIGPSTELEAAVLRARAIDLDWLDPIPPEPPEQAATPGASWWRRRKEPVAPPEPAKTSAFSRLARLALENMMREALFLGDSFLGTEHMLVGVVRVVDDRVAATLDLFGVDYARVLAAVAAADRRPSAP